MKYEHERQKEELDVQMQIIEAELSRLRDSYNEKEQVGGELTLGRKTHENKDKRAQSVD